MSVLNDTEGTGDFASHCNRGKLAVSGESGLGNRHQFNTKSVIVISLTDFEKMS